MGDLVRRPSGWYVRYKDADGRRRQRASHQPTKELARRYLLEIEGRVARGLIGIPEPRPPVPSVAELVARFLSEYSRPKIKDLARYRTLARTALRRALPLIGSHPADGLAHAEVTRLRELLARGSAANSVRLTLSFLSTVYGWAVKSGIVPRNPFVGIELPAREDLIEYLSRDEIARLLALAAHRAASGNLADRLLHACIVLALHTGMRKGELLGLRWRDVNLDARKLTVARSFQSTPKGGQSRHLRLHDSTIPALTAWQRECPSTPEGLVFPVISSSPPRLGRSSDMLGLPELLMAAGCSPLRRAWHALRHSFASHFVMSGGSLLALQKILGHHDVKMTMIYAHLAPDFLGDELSKLKF